MKKYIVYIVIFVVGLIFVSDDVLQLVKGYLHRKKLEAKTGQLDAEYEELKEVKEKLDKGDKEYYEQLARVELKLVKDGELEFRFTPPSEDRK